MNDLPRFALSVRQPWAWAILHAGKDIENRDWRPANPGRRFRGAFLLHASKGMTRAEADDFRNFYVELAARGVRNLPRLPSYDEIPRGGIVGMATVADLVTDSTSPWFFGPLGLALAEAKPLPFTPCTGALGFFEISAETRRELEVKAQAA